ncbi:MAG: hypothetical protein ACD_75C00373G0005 [uncultured bacterium]|nr:MAG: hypothetical protein ACD_75C00373G0005 [uncultured bacterium]
MRLLRCRDTRVGHLPERQNEAEPAAFAVLAFRPDPAAVQFHQHFGESQAKAGAFEFLGIGRFKLGEGLKELAHVLFLDPPAGIGHGYFNRIDGHRSRPDGDRTTRRGKLDRVAEQVEQYLLDFPLVGDDLHIGLRGEFQTEVNPAFQCLFLQHRQRGFEGLGERKGAELQLHFPRFHLGEIEDVVDQSEQIFTAAPNIFQIFLLLVIDRAKQPVEQHLGKTDHRIERGAQFMAHIGEKVGFGPRHQLQPPVALGQFLLLH